MYNTPFQIRNLSWLHQLSEINKALSPILFYLFIIIIVNHSYQHKKGIMMSSSIDEHELQQQSVVPHPPLTNNILSPTTVPVPTMFNHTKRMSTTTIINPQVSNPPFDDNGQNTSTTTIHQLDSSPLVIHSLEAAAVPTQNVYEEVPSNTFNTLGVEINLVATYNRMMTLKGYTAQLDLLARNTDITVDYLKWVILLSSPKSVDIMRDVTEFLEVLNVLEPATAASVQSKQPINNHRPMHTLGANISLETVYNRMTLLKNHTMQLDLLAKSKDVTINQLQLAILFSSVASVEIIRDVTVFLEVLNQKMLITKNQRKSGTKSNI